MTYSNKKKGNLHPDRDIQILTGKIQVLCLNHDKIIEIDLGCGKGTFAIQLALKYPERVICASDIMLGRLRKLRNKKENNKIENLFMLRVESRNLIYDSLTDGSIDRIHILCPDPWPKARHSARRLLCSDFIGRLATVLKPNGVVHFSTDEKKYFDFALEIFEISAIFKRNDELINDIKEIETDFEKLWKVKGLEINKAGFIKI